jgi:hypothetical protein
MQIEPFRRPLALFVIPLSLVALALVVSLPTLRYGFATDDLVHKAMLAKAHPVKELGFYQGAEGIGPAAISLFEWFRGDLIRRGMDYGAFPWWMPPMANVSFWRPLAALTHWLDAQLWPCRPAAMHAHNALWAGALALAAWMAYRRRVMLPWVAGAAAVLLAVNQESYQAVAWIASRNSVIAACFVALTVWLYGEGCARGRGPGWILAALLAMATGLLSGESAVAAAGFLFSYALFLDDRRWSVRLLSVLPFAIIIVLWKAAYQALGFGAALSGFYVDPGREPLRFTDPGALRIA